MVTKALVCCAQSFGYGPAAKLIHLARALGGRGLRLTFLGTGIAHELAARSSAFDAIIPAAAESRTSRAVIAAASGVLSVMDRDYAALALELSRPVYVADSLAWLREQFPPPFRGARRYWVQRFGAVSPPGAALPANAVEVGPIVPAVPPVEREGTTKLVVNLGGGDSPHGAATDDPSYVDFVVGGLAGSGLADCFRGQIVLLAGSRSVGYLRERYGGAGIAFGSVSSDEAQHSFRRAARVLAAPGLTTSLECFQLGVPTFFLPPQNYSQWRILQAFRRLGLAPASFHWEDLPAAGPAPEELPETERTPRIRQCIRRWAQEPAAGRLLQQSLEAGLAVAPAELASRQRAYFDGLGRNGTEQIVSELTELC